MQTKSYNLYRITHKSGTVEEISAENLVEALNNMSIKESFDPVLQTYMKDEGIKTLVSDMPAEVPFTSVVAENSGGSIATPLSGTIHVGDQIALKAIPAANYSFVNWKLNGKVISEEASFVLTMPDLEGEASAIFTATFALSPVSWTTEVEPVAASTAGALVFPTSGITEANGDISLIAVEAEGFTFDHWERNGESISTNKILSATATPLAEGESSAVYKAVFTEA